MDLNSLISQLGGGSKATVYMSVTPGVGLELIAIDSTTKQIKNYSCRPLAYNESLREISDYEAFKQATLEMLDELGLNHKCNVVLNLPMVHFGHKEIQLMVDNEGVTSIITSEVEQSYIFKRYEPSISWMESDFHTSNETRKVFYTAIQQNTIDNIKTALSEIGATLVSVDVSLSSILRGLAYTGLATEQFKDGNSWNLMIINQNGYSICSMMGSKVIDFYEEALAVKSFEGEEIYKAINASAQLTLMSYPANSLYIISETDDVSAEILAKRLQIDGNLRYLENNRHKKQEFMPASLDIIQSNVLKISLEAIGIAATKLTSSPLKFNVLGNGELAETEGADEGPVKIKVGDMEYEVTPAMAAKVALLIDIPIVLLALTLFFCIPMYSKQLDTQLQSVNDEIKKVQDEITQIQDKQKKTSTFDVKAEVKRVLETNRTKLISYAALGEFVPNNLWITYFITKDDAKVDIKGEASNVKEVYAFYRGMKDSMLNNNLRLTKLEMDTESIDDVVNTEKPMNYKFEITNMNQSELSPEAMAQAQEAAAQAQPAPQEEKKNEPMSPLGGNPLINIKK